MNSDPFSPRPLCLATVAACLGALAAREGHVLGLAATLVLAGAARLVLRAPAAVLLAVPGALAAFEPRPPAEHWPMPGPVRVHGRIEAKGHAAHGGSWLRITDPDAPARVLFCVLPGETALLPDELVRGSARLLPFSPEEPYVARVEAAAGSLRRVEAPPTPRRLIGGLRDRLEHGLRAGLDPLTAALTCQVVLGGGPALPEEVRAAHRATGLAHLLAVSGSHLTMLAAMWITLTRRRGLGLVTALLIYTLVTQLQAPVVRACSAFVLAVRATASGRRTTLAAALALPALLTALVWPEDLLSISFQLSYAAVVGLGCAGPARGPGRLERFAWAPLRCSLWAVATTMPLTLWHFGTVAPWTILATPLLAPLVGALLGLGVIKSLLALVSAGLTAPLDPLVHAVAWVYLRGVELFAALPGAPVFAVARPEAIVLGACALLGIGAVLHWRSRAAVLLLLGVTALPHFVALLDRPRDRLRLLAVGHGQACLVELGDATSVLVDCGCLGSPERAAAIARDALLPWRRLDWLVLTHADADHAGGVARLLQLVRVGRAVVPDELVEAPVGRLLHRHGVELLGVATSARVVPRPGLSICRPRVDRASTNDSSLWARLELSGCSVVVSGDAEAAGTLAWLDTADARPATALVLPHHGRKNDAFEALITRTAPRAVLVSNRADEPRPASAAAAAARGIPVYATGELGTITLDGRAAPSLCGERPWRL